MQFGRTLIAGGFTAFIASLGFQIIMGLAVVEAPDIMEIEHLGIPISLWIELIGYAGIILLVAGLILLAVKRDKGKKKGK